MSTRTVIHLCTVGLFALAVLYIVSKWSSQAWQDNPIYPLLAIILLAVVGGVFFVTVILPRIGDAVGTVMYSSGEEVQQDSKMKAAAKIAAGDYEGAISEYQKMIQEDPEDTYPLSEIAKLYAEKLHDPYQAATFLQTHLEGKSWAEDDAAFLMFRMVDLYAHEKEYDQAKAILEQVVGTFPNTRHSGNARHKINEIEQLQYKELIAQRAKQSSQGGEA